VRMQREHKAGGGTIIGRMYRPARRHVTTEDLTRTHTITERSESDRRFPTANRLFVHMRQLTCPA
jgi:hypothetical protein